MAACLNGNLHSQEKKSNPLSYAGSWTQSLLRREEGMLQSIKGCLHGEVTQLSLPKPPRPGPREGAAQGRGWLQGGDQGLQPRAASPVSKFLPFSIVRSRALTYPPPF